MNILTISLETGDYANINNQHLINLLKTIDTNFITEPSEDFYYLLANIDNFHWFLKCNYFNPKYIADLQNNKAKLLFSSNGDSFNISQGSNKNIPDLINVSAKFLNISTSSIIYTDTNYKLESALKKFNLIGFCANVFEHTISTINNKPVIESIKHVKIRNKKFLYLGGRARDFRLRFVDNLCRIPELENTSYVSTQFGTYCDPVTNQIVTVKEKQLDLNPLKFNEILTDFLSLSTNTELHLSSYINIIPMSYFHTDFNHLQLNEKPFKPIATMQPFIIIGERGTLQTLHNLGYKTFNKWIDESYDVELDDDLRFNKILNEVKRLNSFSQEQLSVMLYEMLPILIHNQELHTYRKNNNVVAKELVNKIISI